MAWTVALIAPPLIAAGVEPFRASHSLSLFLFSTLLVVAVVALVGGLRPALAAVAVGVLAGAYAFVKPYNSFRFDFRVEDAPLVAFTVVGVGVAILVDRLARLLEEQAALLRAESALRRVGTLVAQAAHAHDLFAAATKEVGGLLDVDLAGMGRFEADGAVTVVAGWRKDGERLPLGSRWTLEKGNLSALVAETRRAARIDDPTDASGSMGPLLRDASIRSAVAAPITVQALLWGVMIAGSIKPKPLPPGTEARLADFTELLASAIANAESRAELAASRARIVTTSDETRRRIERDLHDGAQQRLVSLGLGLRAAQGSVPPELDELRGEISRVAEGLSSVQDELREIARGIHPAILAEGGIGPALKTLARRSAVPVALHVDADSDLPEPIELATYYIVSESLTNVAKHAHASQIKVDVGTRNGAIHISVCDDGAGGAEPRGGSGLIGLTDRVEALGGVLALESPVGAGTRLEIDIPIGC
jgi:signal transduction histidine kinase